ncbi:CLUMA_CG016901, isoform A [Clunio marinus]|uniref:CLUMA_CG016901, isoform A n=1 Tax=Clunio marinus TaxID=568069 RepID=A0A1J1IWB1_9DIPT|nr:CLUMA_CG016901, isoform A [Clunio marinus]
MTFMLTGMMTMFSEFINIELDKEGDGKVLKKGKERNKTGIRNKHHNYSTSATRGVKSMRNMFAFRLKNYDKTY